MKPGKPPVPEIKALTWNQKKLDYEIETPKELRGMVHWSRTLKPKETRLRDWNLVYSGSSKLAYFPWNQKKLDYEIETVV